MNATSARHGALEGVGMRGAKRKIIETLNMAKEDNFD